MGHTSVEERRVNAADVLNLVRDLRAKLREVEAYLDASAELSRVSCYVRDLECEVRFISVRGGLSARQFRRVCELIEARQREPLEVVELAAAAGLSAAHFTRAFKQTTGKTPHRFMLEQRLERARVALARGQAEKIAGVAIEFGFFDQSHFTRHFRRKFGVTPGDFMRQASRSP